MNQNLVRWEKGHFVAMVFFLLLVILNLPVNAEDSLPAPAGNPGVLEESGLISGAMACGNAFEQAVRSGYNCLMEQVVNGILLGKTAEFANAYGKQLFGQHFSLANRFTYSPVNGGFSGEVDAVVPLSAFTSFAGGSEDGAEAGAFFFQQGLTRWTDRQGLQRYDMRYGMVRRFNMSDAPGTNVVGVSSFFQQNLEYSHARVVTGLDYDGGWGRSTFNYFVPTTGWRASATRAGYEERALEGMELGFHLWPTSTLTMETALTRWEASDGADRWENGARVGFSWQPHVWLNIKTAWAGIGTSTPNPSASVFVTIPFDNFDSRTPIPSWKGLGLADDAARNRDAQDLWRPIENIGRIRVAERVAPRADGLPHGLTVRFLQDSAFSGEAVEVEVTLSAPARNDIRLLVRLVPGEGDNPVVPGEDYVDEPVEVTIFQGTARGVATIRLLRNSDMTEPRSLSVTMEAA